jgi:hypothetical protein|tara:strand:+ start:2530 stop:2721 length:192 start_codon:yes stop_codon:yes gene_type:complete
MTNDTAFDIIIEESKVDDDVELKPVDDYVKEGHISENISEYYDMQITLVNVQAKNRKVKIEVS